MSTAPGDPGRASAEGLSRVEEVEHRGVRWQRGATGALRWRNDEAGTWVRYRRGADAPPRPPGWEPRAGLTLDRPSWRTPYRIVPLILLAAIIVIGALQALHGSGGQDAAEAKAATALIGRCLAGAGSAGGVPVYSPDAVGCATPGALVRVTSVVAGAPGSPDCPLGSTAVVLAYPGVTHPHRLCTVPNGG